VQFAGVTAGAKPIEGNDIALAAPGMALTLPTDICDRIEARSRGWPPVVGEVEPSELQAAASATTPRPRRVRPVRETRSGPNVRGMKELRCIGEVGYIYNV
jgi:hypothetical protein